MFQLSAFQFSRYRFTPSFVGPDPDRFFHSRHENFSVTDLSGLGRLQDRLDHTLGAIVLDHDLKFHFRQKIDRVFAAAINLAVTFLPSEASNFTQRHSLNANRGERVFDRFGFERLNNRLDFFHRAQSRTRAAKRKQMGL